MAVRDREILSTAIFFLSQFSCYQFQLYKHNKYLLYMQILLFNMKLQSYPQSALYQSFSIVITIQYNKETWQNIVFLSMSIYVVYCRYSVYKQYTFLKSSTISNK